MNLNTIPLGTLGSDVVAGTETALAEAMDALTNGIAFLIANADRLTTVEYALVGGALAACMQAQTTIINRITREKG